MEFGLGSYGFGFLAGLLSTLSPCVLPIIPILLGSATHVHPRAPLALAGGLALSYAIIGTALAWAGSALGLDTSIFRGIGAAILGLLGLILMSGGLQQRFAAATSGMGDAGNNLIAHMRLDGLWGQFAIGLVLGVVWLRKLLTSMNTSTDRQTSSSATRARVLGVVRTGVWCSLALA